MKTLKLFILSLLLILSFSTGVKAEFFSDVIVTSANGIWTDSRAYSTLNAAITAVGANQRTVVVASPQIVTALTVPANVTLKFERDGSIANSGQLTINTLNIIADNHQIFTGAGDVDFVQGTIVKSSWFNGLYNALTLTSDDTVTMLITKQETLHTSVAVGNNVTLKWDSQLMLGTFAGTTLSNIGQVEAGNYQIFSGAGNFRFRDGTELNLEWFAHLRSAITHINTNKITLVVNQSSPVDYSDSIPSNINVRIKKGGDLAITGGVTLTLASAKQIDIGPYYFDPFTGAGSITVTGGITYTPATSLTGIVLNHLVLLPLRYEVDALYDYGSGVSFTQATITAALTAIGTSNKTTLLLRPGTWVISSNADWSAYTNVTFKIVPGAVFSHGTYTIKIPNPVAENVQIFSGTGAVTFYGAVEYVTPDWWGVNGNTSTYDTAAVQAAFTSGENVKFTRTYYVTNVLLDLVNANRVVDFNGYTLIGVASVATSSVLEIKENFLTAYKIDVNVNFNTNYTCAVQWRSDVTHTSQYNKIYGMHIWYAMIGLIYGENIGTSSYSAAQSENTIYSFTTHGVQVPLVGNQDNGFLYLVSPMLSCAPDAWSGQPGYNAVTWWTSAYSFNNPVGVLVITGGEILKAGPQGYGIRGKSFYIYGAYLEVASTLGYLTGSATIVNCDSYQGEASTVGYLFVVDRAATGNLYIRKMNVGRLTGLGGTEGNVSVQTDNASDISAVYTVEVHDVEFTEWNVGLYGVAPFITNCAFRVSNIVSKGSTWTTFHIESHNPHLSITVPMSFETGEQTATPIVFPETVTITGITGVVMKALAAADNGTIQGANTTGASASGLLTFNASAPLNTTNGPHTPTTNMVVLKGASYTLTSAKSTAGGKVLVTLHYKKGL